MSDVYTEDELRAMLDGEEPVPASKTESALRGIEQGATAGFADEIHGGVSAATGSKTPRLWEAVAGAIPAVGIPAMVGAAAGRALTSGGVGDKYRETRDSERAANEAAKEANPKTYLGGQIGGGVLSSVAVPGSAGVGAGIKGAALLGGRYGAAAGLGESEADLTRGDVGGAAADTAVGGLAGLAAGAATSALARGAVGASRWAAGKAKDVLGITKPIPKDVSRAAKDIVASSEKPSAGSDYTKSVGETFKESTQKQSQWSKDLGEEVALTPAQASGSRRAALRELADSQVGESMDTAQQLIGKQKGWASKLLDMYTNKVAANPELIGKSGVGKAAVKALDEAEQELITNRSAAAKPFYDTFRKLAGRESVDASAPVARAQGLIKEIGEGAGAEAAGPFKKTLELIKSKPTLENISTELSFWSAQSRNVGTVLDQLGKANKTRMASEMAQALDDALVQAEKAGGSEAAAALRQGREVWRTASEEIENSATATVRKMLKVGDTDAADSVVEAIGKLKTDDQVAGIFTILNKKAPETAANARAQLIESRLVAAGKPARGASVAAEEGINDLSYAKAISSLKGLEPVLNASYAGDPRAAAVGREMLQNSYRMLRTFGFGPGLRGSQTAPIQQELAERAVNKATDVAIDTIAGNIGPGGQILGSTVKDILKSSKGMANVFADPGKAKAVNDAIKVLLTAKEGKKVSQSVVANAVSALERAGFVSASIGANRIR